jgi:rhodanese-related sulfurtransferase
MAGPNSISADRLARLFGTPTAPLLIDVRTADDFAADPRLIPASTRTTHAAISEGERPEGGLPCIIICQRGAKLSEGSAALLRARGTDAISLSGGFEAWREAGLPLVPSAIIPPRNAQGHTRWVTRHRPKIDRIACPWLIRRFVDRRAEFLYVPPDDVPGVAERFNATPYDMAEGYWTHRNDTCTFDTMLTEFGLATPPLLHLARVVRAADLGGRLADEPEAAGLLAVSLGLSRQYSDDLQQLEAGMAVYDALYRWCRDATDETHSWPSPSKAPA